MSNARFVLRTTVFTLAAVVVVYFAVGAILADHWDVSTTRVIEARPAEVARLVRDLRQWPEWSALQLELGKPTTHEIEGEAGAVGQRQTWRGPMGTGTLELTRIAEGAVDYRFAYRFGPGENPNGGQTTGSITWRADPDGCRVSWSEHGELGSWIARWSGWFGHVQEAVKRVQGASLEGLSEAIRRSR